MVRSTKAGKLLAGFRGQPPGDLDALVDVSVSVSKLALDFGDRIRALDINPLLVLPKGQGVKAVDALMELDPSEKGTRKEVSE